MGCAEEGGNDLAVEAAAIPVAFELPGSEASEMEMVPIQSRQRPTARVPGCDFQLISDHGPATDGANGTDPMTAPHPVGILRRQLPETDCFTGLFSNEGFIGHMPLRQSRLVVDHDVRTRQLGCPVDACCSVSRPGM
jgi:hypothetical protein